MLLFRIDFTFRPAGDFWIDKRELRTIVFRLVL